MCSDDNADHLTYRYITELPSDAHYIVESCAMCGSIRSYNIDNGVGKVIYEECHAWLVCKEPSQTLLVFSRQKLLLQLRFSKEKNQLQQIHSIKEK